MDIIWPRARYWKAVQALHASDSKVQNLRNLGIFNWNNDFKISNRVVFVSLLKWSVVPGVEVLNYQILNLILDFYQFTLVCDTTMPAPWHRLNISLCSDYMFWCLLSRNLLQFWPFLAFYGPFRPDSNQSSELDSSSSRFYKRVKDYATVSSPQKVINSNSWIQNELVSNRNEHKKIHCSKHFRNTIYGIWNQALNSYLTYKNANEFKIITIKSSIISSITIIPTGTRSQW